MIYRCASLLVPVSYSRKMRNLFLTITALAVATVPASCLVVRQGTALGSAACANVTAALGNDKVKQPLSLQYVVHRLPDFCPGRVDQSCGHQGCQIPLCHRSCRPQPQHVLLLGRQRCAYRPQHHTEKTYDASTTLGSHQPGGTFGDIYDYFQQYGRTLVGARLDLDDFFAEYTGGWLFD